MAEDPLSRGVDRRTFLARVRRSLEATPGEPESSADQPTPAPAPAESLTRDELVQRFATEARAADTTVARVSSLPELRSHLCTAVGARGCDVLVRGDTPLLRELDADAALHDLGTSVFVADAAAVKSREGLRKATERAQIGLTEVDWAIAESGTLILLHQPGQGRALSLLPTAHLAILPTSRVLPDLPTLFERLAGQTPPSALTMITGPSRTADIEMVITRGVHGPAELHVVLLDVPETDQRG